MPVDGGCHATHQEALDQMTALNIATADERSQRNEDMNAAIDDAIELLMAAKAAHMEGQKELEDEMEDEPMDSSEMEDDDEYRAVNLVAPAFMRAICEAWFGVARVKAIQVMGLCLRLLLMLAVWQMVKR
jgi:hypothetical protein